MLLSIQSINALFISTVGMPLFNISNNLAFTLFRDVGRSYQTASGALYQIGKSLLQVVFTNLKQLARTTTKSTENDMEGNVM